MPQRNCLSLIGAVTRLLAVLGVLLQVACANQEVLRDRDYEPSLEAFRGRDPERAYRLFPHGEEGGLVTSVEKAWLKQWQNQWDPNLLRTHAETIEQRNQIRLSREAATLLHQESEEDYLPAEHEVIILYLLQATHWLKSGHREEAEVELRRAGLWLERWDDEGLRLWLAALWTACGNWDEGRVDLRRAYELGGDPRLAGLAEREEPPPQLNVHFHGVSPDLKWEVGAYKPVVYASSAGPAAVPAGSEISTSTDRWFTHHREKDHSLREIARQGNHLAQVAGTESMSMAETVGSKALTWGVRVTGVAVGTALTAGAVYLMTKSKIQAGGELLYGLTIGAGVAIWEFGRKLDREMTHLIANESQENHEELRTYRMVRYLPRWISVAESGPTDALVSPSGLSVSLGQGVSLLHDF